MMRDRLDYLQDRYRTLSAVLAEIHEDLREDPNLYWLYGRRKRVIKQINVIVNEMTELKAG